MTAAGPLPAVFITGASGFIGRVLLAQLAAGGYSKVTCLARHPASLTSQLRGRAGWECVTGDLNNPASYRDALATADVVIHLAAATGNARTEELQRINVEGTQRLLDACLARKNLRMLFVSSIAAGYPHLDRCPYGRTKLEAEALVRKAGMDFAILRPAIVLGEGSPIWSKLRMLACLPLVPLFGDGTAPTQPVAVIDVARAIVTLAARPRWGGETIEWGGPEVLSFAELMLRIRHACGRAGGRLAHLPARPMEIMLDLAGRISGGRIPVSAGQLAAFVNDSTAAPSELFDRLRPSMVTLDALLGQLARAV